MTQNFKTILFFVASALLVLSACKKKEIINTHPNDSGTNRIKTLHRTYYSHTYGVDDKPVLFYFYDDQNRLIMDSSSNGVTSFTYGSNTITVYNYSPTGGFASDTFTVFLNAQGLMDSVTGPDHMGFGNGNTSVGFSNFKYTYNADGQLIREITPSGTYNYTWSNGDMVSSDVTFSSLADNRDYGDAAFGKHSKHLISSYHTYVYGTTYLTGDYNYQLDALARVTRERDENAYTGVSQEDSTVTVYTYY